jgi:hypothetical protein
MFLYVAYGLKVISALALPELTAGAVKEEITFQFGRVDFPKRGMEAPFEFFAGAESFIAWKGEGAFLFRGGGEIIIDPAPRVSEEILRDILLGLVLAMLLYQR